MEISKTSIMWKTSERRAKWSEIWDSCIVVQYILAKSIEDEPMGCDMHSAVTVIVS